MGMTTKEILQGVHDWTDGKFSQKDGFYEQMVAGEALALAGQTQRTNDAMYRKSGGSEEVTTGTATIANIKGQTVEWNQLVTDGESARTLANSGAGSYSAQITPGHKYLVSFVANMSALTSGYPTTLFRLVILAERHNFGSASVGVNFVKTIISSNTDENSVSLYVNYSSSSSENQGAISKFAITDLTLIYGAGNEPSTVAQFEADYEKWFGKPLTYEAYDAGSLRSVQLDAMKTIGLNQWDEQWEAGTLNMNNGTNLTAQTRIRSKQYIKVIPNGSYWLKSSAGDNGTWRICYYDESKNFVSSRYAYANRDTIIIPQNSIYVRVSPSDSYGNTYNHDICINISDTAKNGTYEPYEEHVAPLPVTTLKGKLNGQGESVTIFPNGMKSAGSIADEIYTVADKTYAVQRVGAVDLGERNYGNIEASTSVFRTNIADYKPSGAINIVCSKYHSTTTTLRYSSPGAEVNTLEDKSTAKYTIDNVISSQVCIKDTSYSNTATFKTAMQGVMLYYELATPLVYEVEGFSLPKTYLVDGGGTEEQVQKANVQGLAAILTCIYGVDAVGFMNKAPQRFIGEDSMDNFLAKLNIATGGTWSKTFNENTGEWDFDFQISANTNANTNESI